MRRLAARWSVAAGLVLAAVAAAEPGARLLEVRRIASTAPHSAFTDLARFRGRWFCVFREAAGHVSHDGVVRVLVSTDGAKWRSAALLKTPEPALPDLRDPKLAVAPGGRLMLTAGAANRRPNRQGMRTYAWFSTTGDRWGGPTAIGPAGFWLWRVTWAGPAAYAVGYNRRTTCLYRSADGRAFEPLVERFFEEGYPNEASLAFERGGRGLCVLRRDGGRASAMLGTAPPPYTRWTWRDLGVRLGGPKLLRLPDGRLLVGGRRYDGRVRTSLMALDDRRGRLREILVLPSGGDTSYPGMVWHGGLLWVSYYSAHEGRASVYVAKVALPAGAP